MFNLPISSPAGAYGWRPVFIMAALFFSIGFVTWLNGPLITFVQVAFNLSDVASFLVPVCFYLAYFIFPLPATLLSKRIGLRHGLVVSLAIMAVGTGLFGECVNARWYAGALSGLTVIGAGLSLLQITINPYVSFLGDHDRAAQRIAIMGVANKFAGIVAPALFAIIVMPHVGEVAARIHNAPVGPELDTILIKFTTAVHTPYRVMAGLLALLAILFARSSLPEITIEQGVTTQGPVRQGSPLKLASGVLAMFLYVGIEVLAGDAIGLFGRSYGLSLDVTKYLTAMTLASMMAGYLVGMVVVPRFISQERYMILSCILGIFVCLLSLTAQGVVPVLCVALLGFTNAMILPALFPIVLAEARTDGAKATAFLVMAFSGGAVLPQIFVHLTPWLGTTFAFMGLVIPSYLFIGLWMTAIFMKTTHLNLTKTPAGASEA